MQIVDTHAHFWDMEALRYPWIERGSPLDRNFLPEDYQCASLDIPPQRIIFIECDAHPLCSIAEADWAASLACIDPRIEGVVAHTSLLADTATATLDAMVARPLVRGIRDNIQGHEPGFALQSDFVRGVKNVHRRGLHFELCLQSEQLEEAIELVRRCPEGTFVLDHCAKPKIRAGLREPWHTSIRAMAALPNVICKISGLVTEADCEKWRPDDVLWYARAAAEAFGAERIMYGSDWPMTEVAGGYPRWFHLAEALAAPWSARDRDRFFRGNAERVYRLGPYAD